ncbi:MAG: hypothetical protein Fur0042_10070 [Cyanophyceae cyanobacterium]
MSSASALALAFFDTYDGFGGSFSGQQRNGSGSGTSGFGPGPGVIGLRGGAGESPITPGDGPANGGLVGDCDGE